MANWPEMLETLKPGDELGWRGGRVKEYRSDKTPFWRDPRADESKLGIAQVVSVEPKQGDSRGIVHTTVGDLFMDGWPKPDAGANQGLSACPDFEPVTPAFREEVRRHHIVLKLTGRRWSGVRGDILDAIDAILTGTVSPSEVLAQATANRNPIKLEIREG